MLNPNERELLPDALRPPDGYRFDQGVATTYSLDLVALLAAPLAFTYFDAHRGDGTLTEDPLALLRALRAHAERMPVFCQAGQITVPAKHQRLFTHLESSVVEAKAHFEGGVFHPKIWVLRFTMEGEPVKYRVLCLSRNLTHDRSWDTVLTLDGDLLDRQKAIAVNHPLGDFLESLPTLAVRPVPESVSQTVAQIAQEVRKVAFDAPQGFDLAAFWPLGIPGHTRWPFNDRIDRLLVISPFLSATLLQRLTEDGEGHVLVARLEELAALEKKPLSRFKEVFAFNQDAMVLEGADDGHLTGLHAKLYIADQGHRASLWTGSANATEAAFKRNVEFLVQLSGKKSLTGVQAALDRVDKVATFASLLLPFHAGDTPVPLDETGLALDRSQRDVASLPLKAQVDTLAEGQYQVTLALTDKYDLSVFSDLDITCWPITTREEGFTTPFIRDERICASWPSLTFEALTSFYAFRVRQSKEENAPEARFVVNIPLVDAPPYRRERILQSLLQDQDQFIRFLLLLLSMEEDDDTSTLTTLIESGQAAWGVNPAATPLFESLLRSLGRDPRQLDQVAAVVDDLRKTPEGAACLPPAFEEIWGPIWAARRGGGQ